MDIEIDFSYIHLPREHVVEYVFLPSGRIVAMTNEESFWFESDGTSPKGSYLIPCPKQEIGNKLMHTSVHLKMDKDEQR